MNFLTVLKFKKKSYIGTTKTLKIIFIMKIKILPLMGFLMLVQSALNAQIAYNQKIDSLINQVFSADSISLYVQELSGEIATVIGGAPYTIQSRHANQPGNLKAAQYILEKFKSFGLPARYMNYSSTGKNVIAIKTGNKYPQKQYIVCGHYDAMPSGTTNYGADDNASGTVGVIEAARVLANFPTEYSILFIAFDEEELGLIGSYAYADSAAINNQQIQGVINLDMIAWDSNNDNKLSVVTNNASVPLADDFINACNVYVPQLDPIKEIDLTANSDHAPFWPKGYQAFLSIEYLDDFNTHYHTLQDRFSTLNLPYFQKMTKAAIATLTALSTESKISIQHTPLASGMFTSVRQAKFLVNCPKTIATGTNAPKLYYRVNAGTYQTINSANINNDTLVFDIPAHGAGTKIDYYFAVQDSAATIMATLPAGGSGFNVPGNIPPANPYLYIIADILSNDLCQSPNLFIPDKVIVKDSILYTDTSVVNTIKVKVNITHPYVSDLQASLISPIGTEVVLFDGVGGNGDNFVNTIFDDNASTAITNGTAPFTGTFRPNGQLANFIGTPTEGQWKIKLYDKYNTDQGTLTNWCIMMTYPNPNAGVNIHNIEVVDFSVYPNPVSNTATIKFYTTTKTDVNVELLDIAGRKINETGSQVFFTGQHQMLWDLSNTEQGVYVARITYKQGNTTHAENIKLIIKH